MGTSLSKDHCNYCPDIVKWTTNVLIDSQKGLKYLTGNWELFYLYILNFIQKGMSGYQANQESSIIVSS